MVQKIAEVSVLTKLEVLNMAIDDSRNILYLLCSKQSKMSKNMLIVRIYYESK